MSGFDGDPVHAVLPPPQLRRFRTLAGVAEDEPLTVVVGGWHKHVLLTADRAFLFPRHEPNVGPFERELTAYDVLARADVPLVPRLLGRWDDEDVHPYPFAAVTRLPGRRLDDPVHLFGQLGRAIAAWHDAAAAARAGDGGATARPRRPAPAMAAPRPRPTAPRDAVEEAVERLAMFDQRAPRGTSSCRRRRQSRTCSSTATSTRTSCWLTTPPTR